MAIDLSAQWLTIKEVATWLRVSVTHVGDQIHTGKKVHNLIVYGDKLPAIRVGRCLRIDEKDLEEFIKRNSAGDQQVQPATE